MPPHCPPGFKTHTTTHTLCCHRHPFYTAAARARAALARLLVVRARAADRARALASDALVPPRRAVLALLAGRIPSLAAAHALSVVVRPIAVGFAHARVLLDRFAVVRARRAECGVAVEAGVARVARSRALRVVAPARALVGRGRRPAALRRGWGGLYGVRWDGALQPFRARGANNICEK